MAHRGAPVGNRNAARGHAFNAALRRVLDNYEAAGIRRGEALGALARKLVEMALDGNLQAITAIADRLDGRPAQQRPDEAGGEAITVVFEDAIATRPEGYTRQQLAGADLD